MPRTFALLQHGPQEPLQRVFLSPTELKNVVGKLSKLAGLDSSGENVKIQPSGQPWVTRTKEIAWLCIC
jgi:hypothetical protein